MPNVRRSLKRVGRAPIISVSITREIIDTAIRENTRHCMVAMAIQAQYPKYTHIAVDLQTIRFSDPERGLRYTYLTPRAVQQALVLFDQGHRCRPIEFKLRGAHTSAMRMINRVKGRPVRERIRLGRRRLVPDPNSRKAVPETIGGPPPPRDTARSVTLASNRREFGLRALSPADIKETAHKE